MSGSKVKASRGSSRRSGAVDPVPEYADDLAFRQPAQERACAVRLVSRQLFGS